ncbi:methylated-DNA-protein-cysteine methyltransferase related protein, partial [Tremellales sp. Uapishka_1]
MSQNIVDLTAKTYELVREIPYGKVTTYGRWPWRTSVGLPSTASTGHIAKLAGYPTCSRHVGNALKMLPLDSTVPWQRVISSKGLISPRGDQGQGAARQKDRLEAEGVEVETLAGAGGERVDLRIWGWFPEQLPG